MLPQVWHFCGSCNPGKHLLFTQEGNIPGSELPSCTCHPTLQQPSLLLPWDTTVTRTEAGKENGMFVLELFYLPLERLGHCKRLPVQRAELKLPHHCHPDLAHSSPGQLMMTKKQHQCMKLQTFPTNILNVLCCTSCISPHSFLDHSVLEIIRGKNLNGCGPELYVPNSHFHQNRSSF